MFFLEIPSTPYVSKEKQHINIHQNCRKCGAHESVYIVPIFMIWSVILLPLSPTGVKGFVVRCKSCGVEGGDYNIDDSVIKKIKTPLYLYSGIIILAILLTVICGFVTIEQAKDKKAEIMENIVNPKVKRTFLVRVSDEKKVFYKTTKVEGDSVFFQITDPDLIKEYNEKSKECLKLNKRPDEVLDVDYYFPTVVRSIEDLKEMYRNGDVIEIVK